ncbi:DUF4239 domain-containing protein [Actinomadura oligospora]|uniref:bestrophin-like domain n=1 Tax=Actinomadura oligospora TaxID=111804 RepID=UPI0004BC19A9|nr:DUF4239 domain-containing protein [Actinomadura oligospora]
MSVVIVAVLVASVLIGLGAMWIRRSRGGSGEGSVAAKDLLGPVLTLTVLVLAFVLVAASKSYDDARNAAADEANAVSNLYESAAYAPQAQRQQIEASMACYARAVVHHEWEIDNGKLSPVVSHWSSQVRTAFAGVATSSSPIFGTLISADQKRGESRITRVDESQSKTPGAIYIVVLIALAMALIGFALLMPTTGNRPHIIALVAVGVLFGLVLLLIRDLEAPFTGNVTIAPTAMSHTAERLAAEYNQHFPQQPLPCDATGKATA